MKPWLGKGERGGGEGTRVWNAGTHNDHRPSVSRSDVAKRVLVGGCILRCVETDSFRTLCGQIHAERTHGTRTARLTSLGIMLHISCICQWLMVIHVLWRLVKVERFARPDEAYQIWPIVDVHKQRSEG